MPSAAEKGAPGERAGRGAASAPAELAEFQRWFSRAASRALARAFAKGGAPRPRAAAGTRLREENARLRAGNGMSGAERLAVYNQQYWLRLVACMQESYPCALHVLGLDAFNAWAMRFLSAHRPSSPYLAELDAGFPAYLARHCSARDRARALQAAAYDQAFARAFDGAPGAPPGDFLGKLALAPHATVLALDWDFPAYRALCLEDAAGTGRFPLRPKKRALCLYRFDGMVYEKTLSRPEARLLGALRKPRTLQALFRSVEREEPRMAAALAKHVNAWFRDWTELGLLTAAPG